MTERKRIDNDNKSVSITGSPGVLPWGIYLHVPFCLKRCRYCNFYSKTDQTLEAKFVAALIKELDLVSPGALADTIYFGGGTPSLLSADSIEAILHKIKDRFSVQPASEITLEANPATIDHEKLIRYQKAGINRLNIGVQSFNDDLLKFLGRVHSASEARETIETARSQGFENIGLDLIFGVPGQEKRHLYEDLQSAILLKPEHISCYLLTIEENTPLGKAQKQGKVVSLPDDVTADYFECIQDFLSENGYRQYEISNYSRIEDGSKRGFRSRHNLKYWQFASYLGFGPSAHSFTKDMRWWNHNELDRYLKDIEKDMLPIAASETLTREQKMIETLYLGLRQSDGFSISDFKSRFDFDISDHWSDQIQSFVDQGLLEEDPVFLRLTQKGMRFVDHITSQLIALI